MDTATSIDLGTLLGAIAAMLTALFGGIRILISVTNKPIHKKIDNLKTETKNEFNKIATSLLIVHDTVTRKEVIDSLRAAARGYIHFNKGLDSRTKILIDSQCERIVGLAEETMSETFGADMLEQITVKLEEAALKARAQIKELYTEDFLELYIEIQVKCIDEYKAELTQLSRDRIVNSKYTRFRVITESFLHNLVGQTITLVHNWQQEHCKRKGDGDKILC